jgi:hypothetical protein
MCGHKHADSASAQELGSPSQVTHYPSADLLQRLSQFAAKLMYAQSGKNNSPGTKMKREVSRKARGHRSDNTGRPDFVGMFQLVAIANP